jgi:hypothetical protein
MRTDGWVTKFAPHIGTHLHSEFVRYLLLRVEELKDSLVVMDSVDDIRVTQGRLRELHKLEKIISPKQKSADTL